MSKTLAILGAGALGLQIAHFAMSDAHFDAVVFFDDFTNENSFEGYSILGNSGIIEKKYQDGLFDVLLIGIGYKHLTARKTFYEKFKGKIPFATLIHSSAWVDTSAVIHEGTIIYPKACIDQRVEIGPNTLINLNVTIAHDTKIGGHNFISPCVAIAGFCSIGEQIFLGIQTTVIDTILISDQVVTGGGAVVVDNILEPGLYLGNPVKKR